MNPGQKQKEAGGEATTRISPPPPTFIFLFLPQNYLGGFVISLCLLKICVRPFLVHSQQSRLLIFLLPLTCKFPNILDNRDVRMWKYYPVSSHYIWLPELACWLPNHHQGKPVRS